MAGTRSTQDHAYGITRCSAEEIAHKVRTRVFTATLVLESFVKAAELSHSLTNCIVTFMLKEAFELAKYYDNRIAMGESFSEEEYPLLGVPISIKDMLSVEGYDTTCAFKSLTGKPATEDAVIVKLLKDCGAIPFCKTTVPQFGLLFETHPLSKKYTPGGSSGGEASLISTYGSCLGVGTDIGGSVRIPSHYCGLYTIKPTASRFGKLGMVDISFGQECLIVASGPMARSVKDLELFTRAVLLKEPWKYDNDVPPIKYREITRKPKRLRIGYYFSDGIFPPTPAVERALNYTIKSLRSEGHELFEYMPTDINEAFEVFQKLMTADKFRNSKRLLIDERISVSILLLTLLVNIYDWLKSLIILVLAFFAQKEMCGFVESTKSKSVSQLWELQHQKKNICMKANKKWLGTKTAEKEIMDAVISPVLPIPAHKIGNFHKIFYIAKYTVVYNMLDYPAGVIPVTKVDPKTDAIDKGWYDKNIGVSYRKSLLHKILYKLYDPEETKGFPVGIQIAGRRFEEEKLLQTMKEIDRCVNSN